MVVSLSSQIVGLREAGVRDMRLPGSRPRNRDDLRDLLMNFIRIRLKLSAIWGTTGNFSSKGWQ
jgi:hypothetical protein